MLTWSYIDAILTPDGSYRVNLWEKLEEVEPESWDEFTELFSRQVVASKPLKPRPENKPAKQQAIKSNNSAV